MGALIAVILHFKESAATLDFTVVVLQNFMGTRKKTWLYEQHPKLCSPHSQKLVTEYKKVTLFLL